ncbi:transcriptional regulator [Colwellia sp. MT41]|uniref:Transcriptional regulator of eicosapentaenoic acid synthesis PfaR n=1 Tax=Colwellia marinimaniae TaxID=1513592 RepID=A0ABQ0MYS0_9GAMM|nr:MULTISPECIES: transcriptional regulator [Colwellia]ALO34522.1 transcriptional regulator [Colwellia sp. MT41]GAW97439.1 transcriptional regulator of eicosapentaenoic acid synthesis PfaR [Colwellia marinimaniae]
MIKQHANATTTPEMRAFIHESALPTAVLARLLKISESTVRKWRKRESLADASHVPKQLNTTLSEAQEYVVVELRTRLLLSLDELLAVSKQFINVNVSRAGLQRCLKRHGVSRLADMQEGGEMRDADSVADETVAVAIEDTKENKRLVSQLSPSAMREVLNKSNNLSPDEVVQIKVTQLPHFADESKVKTATAGKSPEHRRLLIANDPSSNWVYVDIYDGNEREAASRYMSYVLTKAPFHIRRILAGNYAEFLSRFRLLNESPDEASALSSRCDDQNIDSENANKY